MKNYIVTAAAIASVVAVMPLSSVSANEQVQEQEQEQRISVECTHTGAYGQETTSTCSAEGEQYQRQRVLGRVAYRDGKVIYHKPEDTALDTKTMLMVLAIATVSTGAYMLNRRLA